MTRALRFLVSVIPGFFLFASTGCDREKRSFRDTPPASIATDQVTMSQLQPGEAVPAAALGNPYEENAYAVSEGKRLYQQFNCTGCHSHGGGGIGPPLMDAEWIYGSEPENVYATIVQGRPNGMPTFGRRLTGQQVWQLVAYVRSLSGLIAEDVRTGRDDGMQVRTQEQALPTLKPRQSFTPPSSIQP
jgi:cytochrome c oxidase cbb3-type subunit III